MYGDPQGAEQSLQLNRTLQKEGNPKASYSFSLLQPDLGGRGANEERVRVAAGGKAGRGGNSIVRGDALAWEAWPGLRPAWNILEI